MPFLVNLHGSNLECFGRPFCFSFLKLVSVSNQLFNHWQIQRLECLRIHQMLSKVITCPKLCSPMRTLRSDDLNLAEQRSYQDKDVQQRCYQATKQQSNKEVINVRMFKTYKRNEQQLWHGCLISRSIHRKVFCCSCTSEKEYLERILTCFHRFLQVLSCGDL